MIWMRRLGKYLLCALIGVLLPSPSWAQGASNPMHPAFRLLDGQGRVIPRGEKAPDQARTCGQCHSTDYIKRRHLEEHAGTAGACLSCHYRGGEPKWTAAGFSPDSMLKPEWVRSFEPADSNCAACHGLADVMSDPVSIPKDYQAAAYPTSDWELKRYQLTRATGSVFSSQDIDHCLLNLSGKQGLLLPWDVHAKKLVHCTDCHFARNNPRQFAGGTGAVAGLRGEPRRETISEYLKQPDHVLVSANCAGCHDPLRGHDFLPYPKRHFQTVACQSCHIPRQYGPAERAVDATLLDVSGNPLVEYRGVDSKEATNLNTVYSRGFAPALMAVRNEEDGGRSSKGASGPTPVVPVNLVTRWYWASGKSSKPVSREVLLKALTDGGNFRSELVAALDTNHDGKIERSELRINSPSKKKVVEGLLIAAGVKDPVIRSETRVREISHGVAPKAMALSDCSACHGAGSRLKSGILLASWAPGGVLPEMTGEKSIAGRITLGPGGEVIFREGSKASQDLYVFGSTRGDWPDRLGLAMLICVVLAAGVHGGYRLVCARRLPRHSMEMRREYLFSAYERAWHWVMALSVLGLIVSGLRIHLPGMDWLFGRGSAVAVHNFFGVVLASNAFLALFQHLTTGAIRQFLPESKGLALAMKLQSGYYLGGIFKGLSAPFPRSPDRKLNVLQQITYLGLLGVLFPFQIATGAMIWLVGKSPGFAAAVGGLHTIAPLHNLGSWMFLSFFAAHLYLATTGHTVMSHLRGMMEGYEEVEVLDTGRLQSISAGGKRA